MLKLDELGLQINSPLVTPTATNFRPPSWPPPPDWAPVLDKEGKPVCFYKDSIWQLRGWGGKTKQLNFGDGSNVRTTRIDPSNANLLRLLITWKIWGPRGARTVGSIKNFYDPIRAIVALCSQEGILASDLMRFHVVVDKISQCLSPSKYDYAISVLHEIWDARESLGFTLLDRDGIARLAKSRPDHDKKQTPFIPPRIWAYQVTRLRECLDDFFQHREKIEACFHFICDAYAKNHGTLTSAYICKGSDKKLPFQNPKVTGINGTRNGLEIHGPFKLTEDRFGLGDLFDRWLGKDDGKRTMGVVRFSRYLSLVSLVGLKYLLNFSLMRIDEGWNLRSNCLLVEMDEILGNIYILRGETTKTDPDSDARWPTSPSAKLAVDAMAAIAHLRIRCAQANPFFVLSEEDATNPYLLGPSHEPWSPDGGRGHEGKKDRQSYQSYAVCIAKFPFLFNGDVLVINEKDLQLARLIEPSLNENIFAVGKVWSFAYHQLRRTGAVNMLSSGMVSEPSIQYQLKHAARAMTMYYGHNYTRLSLDAETRRFYLTTMYQILGQELARLTSSQFVSPHGEARKEQIVSFISTADSKKLETAGRQGEISARKIRLGFCMKRANCEYGGVESIAHCGGGDTGTPCIEVLYDKAKAEKNKLYGLDLDRRLASTKLGSHRHTALLLEKKSLENYYAVTRREG